MQRQSINEYNGQLIIELYRNNKTLKEIGIKIELPTHQIRRYLLRHNIPLRRATDYKWKPSESEILEIIKLYLEEKRGIQFLANKYHTTWDNIRDVLKKQQIHLWSRTQLAVSNRHHYGPTKGFLGRKHTLNSKHKISNSLFKNCNRTVTGSKSQFIETILGKVQGSFELAYLQRCINNHSSLPQKATSVRTPMGVYFPDFEYEDRFVEIKSPFTWDVCRGFEKNPKGVKSDLQYQKIQWTSKTVKPVEIVILSQIEVLPLFRQAIKNESLIIDKVIYKNGKYFVLDDKLKVL